MAAMPGTTPRTRRRPARIPWREERPAALPSSRAQPPLSSRPPAPARGRSTLIRLPNPQRVGENRNVEEKHRRVPYPRGELKKDLENARLAETKKVRWHQKQPRRAVAHRLPAQLHRAIQARMGNTGQQR